MQYYKILFNNAHTRPTGTTTEPTKDTAMADMATSGATGGEGYLDVATTGTLDMGANSDGDMDL